MLEQMTVIREEAGGVDDGRSTRPLVNQIVR
jgi:hypothetical protein